MYFIKNDGTLFFQFEYDVPWHSKPSDCVNCHSHDTDNVKVALEVNSSSLKEIPGGIH